MSDAAWKAYENEVRRSEKLEKERDKAEGLAVDALNALSAILPFAESEVESIGDDCGWDLENEEYGPALKDLKKAQKLLRANFKKLGK